MHSYFIIFVMAIVTYCTRAFPFLLWSNRKMNPIIEYLGKTLPYAMMGLLIIYSFKRINITGYPFGLPEIISSIVCILLHLWKRNNLISICGSTILYMLILQNI